MAAPTQVGTAGEATNSNTVQCSLAGVNAHSLITIHLAGFRTTPQLPTIAGSNGTPEIAARFGPSTGGYGMEHGQWYLKDAAAGAHTFTITMGSAAIGRAVAIEWPGIDTVAPLDATNGPTIAGVLSTKAGSTFTTTAAITVATDLVIVSASDDSYGDVPNDAGLSNPPAGYTTAYINQDASSFSPLLIAYKDATGGLVAQSAVIAFANEFACVAGIAAYKLAGAPAGGLLNRFRRGAFTGGMSELSGGLRG